MGKYKVVFDREDCIGAAACVAAYPEMWKMAKDGKADLKGSKEKSENLFELEIDDNQLEKFKAAVAACPVSVIHIFDKKSEKKII